MTRPGFNNCATLSNTPLSAIVALIFCAVFGSGCGASLIGTWGAIAASGGSSSSPTPTTTEASNEPPSVVLTQNPQPTQVDTVSVAYTLVDAESDPANLLVEYSLDGGASFEQAPATEVTSLDTSVGVSNLAATPSGKSYTFVWNAFFDLGPVAHSEVRIRLTATDSSTAVSGTPTTTTAFALNNTYIGTLLDGTAELSNQTFLQPTGIAVGLDDQGQANRFVVTDQLAQMVQAIEPATGNVTALAGNGSFSLGDTDHQLATTVGLGLPRGVAIDPAGSVYFAESATQRIRRIDAATGFLTTVAGGGSLTNDSVLATDADLGEVTGLAIDALGNLYVSTFDTNRVRVVNTMPQTISFRDGTDAIAVEPAKITTLIDTAASNVFASSGGDQLGGLVLSGLPQVHAGITPAQNVTTSTATLEILVTNPTGRRVLRRAADGTETVFASNALFGSDTDRRLYPFDLAVVEDTVFVSDSIAHTIWAKPLDGSTPAEPVIGTGNRERGFNAAPVTFGAALLDAPQGIAAYSVSGTPVLLIADRGNQAVRAANLSTSTSVVVANQVIQPQHVATIAANAVEGDLTSPGAMQLLSPPSSDVLMTDLNRERLLRINQQTRAISEIAVVPEDSLGGGAPVAIALNPDGSNAYLALRDRHCVVTVDFATGAVSVVAGKDGEATGDIASLGDGGVATDATLNQPTDLALEVSNNVALRLYICDSNNHRIRYVELTGNSAGTINTLVNTATVSNNQGTKPTGGFDLADPTLLNTPLGIGLDRLLDRLLIADTENARVLAVQLSPSGPTGPVAPSAVTVVAGTVELIPISGFTPASGYNGDNIPATTAQLSAPIDVDAWSNGVLILDRDNHRIRKVTGALRYAAGGIIDTVAGTGSAAYNGDGIPAVNAALNTPLRFYLYEDDTYARVVVIVADTDNVRLRRFAFDR